MLYANVQSYRLDCEDVIVIIVYSLYAVINCKDQEEVLYSISPLTLDSNVFSNSMA